MQPVPDRAEFASRRRVLRRGETADLEELAAWLVDHGYRNTEAVEVPGEFSRRGGILDVYSPDAEAPHRLEFFGDEIESIRPFSPQTQRSLGDRDRAEWAALAASASDGDGRETGPSGAFADYLPEDAWTVLVEADDLQRAGAALPRTRSRPDGSVHRRRTCSQRLLRFPSVTVSALPSPSVEATFHLHVESVERFSGDVARVRDELDGVAARRARADRLPQRRARASGWARCWLRHELAQSDRLRLVVGRVRAGFRLVGARRRGGARRSRAVPPRHAAEVRRLPSAPRRRLESRAIDSFLDLNEGDLVVHVSHGIARYRGLQLRRPSRTEHDEETPDPRVRRGDQALRPGRQDRPGAEIRRRRQGASRRSRRSAARPGRSARRRSQAAVVDLASEMIEIQAVREAQPGFAFPPDTDWLAEFEAAFPYRGDARPAHGHRAEIKRDMAQAASRWTA